MPFMPMKEAFLKPVSGEWPVASSEWQVVMFPFPAGELVPIIGRARERVLYFNLVL